MRRDLEHQEQKALFQYGAVKGGKWLLLFSIPNGGKRNIITATKLKAEGVKAGVPDMCLPVARMGFHALYIELKAGKNKPTPSQKGWIKALTEEGNLAICCHGWIEAKNVIENYLKECKA
jgi:hypothetical protein